MVDIGASASGENTRRKMDSFVDSVVEVIPLDLYDSFRAKIAANLHWIFAKAYGVDNVPEELKDPFYIDQYEQEHIKPPVIKLLLSSELYCRVCSLILKGDQVAALQGHQPVIEALSQKGIYVMESEDTPVSEADLCCAPIKMSAHMSMIDALMMAYTVEMISIEKVVASVKRFSTFSASKELPYDLEDAMVFWINKVNLKMREILEKEQRVKQQIIESPSHQKVRYRRDHPSNRHLPYFPLLEDLMKDISDGAALLAVIHFYCPEQMKLDDICLKEVPSIADNLYNIQLLKEFSSEYLNKCFYLTLEDMLYSPPVLKPNFMVFIAELFWWFENVKPDFVQPRDIQELKEAKSVLPHKSSRPQIPISNATKRSFMASPSTTVDSHSETRSYLQLEEAENGKGSTAFSPSHPLLPLRQKQQKTVHSDDSPNHRDRANSLTRTDVPSRSSVAWAEKRQRPLSQPPFALHCADDVDATSGDSISLARSISKDSLASNIINATPKHQLPISSAPVSSKSLLRHVDMEDEEEELVAYIRSGEAPNQEDLELQSISSRASSQQETARSPRILQPDIEKTDGFFLEPLMPAILKPAKEKQIVHKREEYGEGKPKGFVSRHENEASKSRNKIATNRSAHDLNRTYTPVSSSVFPGTESPRIEPLQASMESAATAFRPLATSSVDLSVQPSGGFFLHDSKSDNVDEGNLAHLLLDKIKDQESTWTLSRQDSDSDNLDLEEECDQELPLPHLVCKYIGEEESAKLQEDMKVKENDDKDDASGRSSPCLSTISQVSSLSLASGSVRMTSFAERKFQRLNSYETKSSTSSSQKTTPDGSECCPPPLTTWKQRREQSPGGQSKDHTNVLASELVQLHMQLEEKRRAIEAQKKKMESLSARQRLKLGKAAFLNVVKKSKHDGTTHMLRPEHPLKDFTKQSVDEADAVSITSKAEQVLEKSDLPSEVSKRPNVQEYLEQKPREPDLNEGEMCNVECDPSPDDVDSEIDANECNLSIEKLNETISTLQQAILKISQQQELLMKAPASVLPSLKNSSQDLKLNPPVHFVEPLSPPGAGTGPRKNRFGPGRSARSSRVSEHKMSKEKMQNSSRVITPTQSIETLPHLKPVPALKSAITLTGDVLDKNTEQNESHPDKPADGFRLHEDNNQRTFVLSTSKDANILSEQAQKDAVNNVWVACMGSSESSGKENVPVDEQLKIKSSLIEVDLSELKDPDEEEGTENTEKSTDIIVEDQKSGVGFFFKDEQKAEDELAKKRAAFLLKQQKKAEEARLRKQQLEAEIELKRDEARRKAEEERIRKDEEKARRELIKQEYLRRKQQQILEEQGIGRPKPKPKAKKSRPKSVHREESNSDSGTKYSSTPDNLSSAQSGSSLSLASGATTEAESVHSGGTPSHRVDSVEALTLGSRHHSKTAERDWENASTASSIASVAEYSGPKLYREPSSKSNKPIIHNAISHCCLAGKVNETQKNQTLDELEKCDSNHYIILFRDAGCQFRALYSYYPDSEEICKLTGTGPKSISKKMIDKLYKYSSDRKQFTVIPAKTMSVSVDALTIHNHLWQAKRPPLPKKNPVYK
ncbi:calmodulin-regulated spectrin-associated protein 1 isoform X2 [Pyxicephalus adspersus]|uniref:calmodulin-regulated spectrin-associated protein 1 isoform X2 n=1 Tax=Pyxicephalus adspersus TaxID=30357 RepID=UPI003B5C7DB4